MNDNYTLIKIYKVLRWVSIWLFFIMLAQCSDHNIYLRGTINDIIYRMKIESENNTQYGNQLITYNLHDTLPQYGEFYSPRS